MVDVDRQRWDEEENIQDKPQPKHMKTKAKGDGKKRKRENIVKKAPNLAVLILAGFYVQITFFFKKRKDICHNKNLNLFWLAWIQT